MHPIENRNYYEIMELPYHATWEEIRMAYELAKNTYGENAMASYSLFDDGERSLILDKVEEAYQVLSDPAKRRKYDAVLNAATPRLETAPASPSPPPTEEPLPDAVTGKVMKALREKKGISLEDIADATRINLHYLESLEQDRFDFLPAEVYVRSYLKQYARMIRCEDQIVERYMKGYHTWLQPKR